MGIKGLAVSVALSASLCAAAAVAAAETYTVYLCDFVIPGGDPSKLLIAVDKSNKAFTYHTKPGSQRPDRVPVTVRKGGPDALIYSYALNFPNVDGQTGRFDFQVRIPKDGGSSRISIQGRGYSKGPRGNGTCKLERNTRLRY